MYLYKQKADQLHTMVQTLLINRVRENPANPDASSDESPSREMTDSERSEEKVKIHAKIKESAEKSKGIARFGVRKLWKQSQSTKLRVVSVVTFVGTRTETPTRVERDMSFSTRHTRPRTSKMMHTRGRVRGLGPCIPLTLDCS